MTLSINSRGPVTSSQPAFNPERPQPRPVPYTSDDGFEDSRANAVALTAPSSANTLASITAAPASWLRAGSSGPAVEDLQRVLRDAGFDPGPLDGKFGPKTEAALRAFQAANGLGVDGVAGPQSREALQRARGEAPVDQGTPPPADRDGWTDEATGRQFDSRDGVPLYNQGDAEWGSRTLGNSGSVQRKGCAITAAAMAVSYMSGQTVTPKEMDQYLDANGGYSGDNVYFDKVGNAVNPPVDSERRWGMTPAQLDRELAAGRPVVIGVDKNGNSGADHWVVITGKNPDGTYNVNDPDGGRTLTMRLNESGRLVGTNHNGATYRFTGDAVTFS